MNTKDYEITLPLELCDRIIVKCWDLLDEESRQQFRAIGIYPEPRKEETKNQHLTTSFQKSY